MSAEPLYSLLLTTGRASGIGAFFLLGLTIFLGGTARPLMKSFKGVKLFKLHERVGNIACLFLFMHPLLVLTAKAIGGTALFDFLSVYIGYPPFITGLILFTIFTLTVLSAFLRKLVKRFIWLNMMRISIVAHLAVLYHLYNLGSLSGPYGELPLLNLIIAAGVVLSIGGTATRVAYPLLARR